MKVMGKKRILGALALTVALSAWLGASIARAYASNATMDYSWGFNKGSSRQRQIMYYQYGNMNWRSYVDHEVNQINNNPAAVSCYYGSSYSSADIVVSSNYWVDDDWTGSAYAPLSEGQKTVRLNSAKATSYGLTDWQKNGTVTHEFTHVWGINDSEDRSSISCGYTDRKVNTITSDVTTLFKNRYN